MSADIEFSDEELAAPDEAPLVPVIPTELLDLEKQRAMEMAHAMYDEHTRLDPATRQAIAEDAVAFRPLARSMAAVMSYNVFREISAAPIPQRLAFIEQMAKYGELLPKEKAATGPSAGFSIQINIPSATPGAAAQTTTIEATAMQIDDLDDE